MSCKPISKEDAEALWERLEESRRARAAKLPTEHDALNAMFEAFDRLRELGWKEAMYAPRDTPLEVIEMGSTGIHKAQRGLRDGDDRFWIFDGDCWPSKPCLYRIDAGARPAQDGGADE